jgi:hypothetical protein
MATGVSASSRVCHKATGRSRVPQVVHARRAAWRASAESNWGQWRMRFRDLRDASEVVVDPKGQLSVASYRDVYGDDRGKNA